MKKKRYMVGIGFLAALMLAVSCSQYAKEPGLIEELSGLGRYPASESSIKTSQWGYINVAGNFVIQPKFDRTEDFQKNGLAIVTVGEYQGVIDKDGQYVVEPKYGFINQYSEGLAVVWNEEGYKVLNENGQVVFESPSHIQNFKNGRAVISKQVSDEKYLYGYIDKNGEKVIELQYEHADSFVEDKALVKLDEGPFALIDSNGKVINQYDNFYHVNNLSEGLMTFEEKEDSKTGYINEKGEVVIPARFSWGDEFNNGLAVVNLSENYFDKTSGVINKEGEYILEPEYIEVRMLGQGRIAAGVPIDGENPPKGSKYALASREGKLLTGFDYYYIYDFHQGLASVYDGTYTYFIDLKGKKQKELPIVKGNGQLSLVGELIKADVDNRISYYNKKGEQVWKWGDTYMLADGTMVKEEKYRPNRSLLIYYPQLSDMKEKSVQKEVNKRLKEIFIPEQYRDVKSDEDLDYNYEGDFNVKFSKNQLLNIEMGGYDFPYGAAHGMPIREYIHIDTGTGAFYQLQDLFKKDSDYVKRLSEVIEKQIEEHGEEMWVWKDDYKGIAPDQSFAILENTLQIYFYPYEIAPYAAGFPTFTIPYQEVMDIIDTQGDLWKAFH
ncbi:MAG: WG repeat-containing protein [Clostridia bacterium]